VAGGHLLWAYERGFEINLLDLASLSLSTLRPSHPREMVLVAVKGEEVFAVDDTFNQERGGDLFAVNLRTGEDRKVLAGGRPFAFSLYQFDGDDLYFMLDGEEQDSFMRLRADSGQTEFLGREPQRTRAAFRVDHGFVYWNREVGRDAYELSRRALGPDAPVTKLAPTKDFRVVPAIAHGRVYYLDEGSLWSVPADGSQPPTQQLDGTGPGAQHLLVDGPCAYWTSAHAIRRLRLDGDGPHRAEVVADETTYRDGPIATDGRFLYWEDLQHDRFMRIGRDSRAISPKPARVAHPLARWRFLARRPLAAVVDFPPPPGTTWPVDYQIHHDCRDRPTPLPACAPGAQGQPWASLAGQAAKLAGQTIAVRDRLVLGPITSDVSYREHTRRGNVETSVLSQTRALALGAGTQRLSVFERLPGYLEKGRFSCTGDESRLCCKTQGFGQLVIATGKLNGDKANGWQLWSAEICEVQTE
jgi:hypothetical protein